MGKGTTIGWMGWRKMATAVGVLRGRGRPSFFMAIGRWGRGNLLDGGKQNTVTRCRRANRVPAEECLC